MSSKHESDNLHCPLKNDRLTQLSVGLLAMGQYLEILTAKITHDFFKVAYLYEN